MDVLLYNTLTRKKEKFVPLDKDNVKMYVCGPTVNDVPHLGHARQQITFDLLRKMLIYNGFKVKFVSNVTDIEDKIINKANELGMDIHELTEKNLKAHLEDYEAIHVSPPDVRPRATEFVTQMIELIQRLESKNATYVIEDDGVYFDISKFGDYGKLSHQSTEDLQTGARVKVKDAKRTKEDFVLWKFSKPGEPAWESPWGEGRPGWHIECSAMSYSILGLPLDIHGGGQDLIFPHHEDEIAQSEVAYGKELARYWVHNGMVNVDKVKMSKSLGNFKTIRDLLKKYSGGVIRYFVLSSHYRSPLDFSEKNLDAAKNAFARLERKIIEIRNSQKEGKDLVANYGARFVKAVNDDLNTPEALQVLWAVVDDENFDSKLKLKLLEKFDSVLELGISEMREKRFDIPEEVKKLLAERERLRKEKKWTEADKIREAILAMGFVIEDSQSGAKLVQKE